MRGEESYMVKPMPADRLRATEIYPTESGERAIPCGAVDIKTRRAANRAMRTANHLNPSIIPGIDQAPSLALNTFILSAG